MSVGTYWVVFSHYFECKQFGDYGAALRATESSDVATTVREKRPHLTSGVLNNIEDTRAQIVFKLRSAIDRYLCRPLKGRVSRRAGFVTPHPPQRRVVPRREGT